MSGTVLVGKARLATSDLASLVKVIPRDNGWQQIGTGTSSVSYAVGESGSYESNEAGAAIGWGLQANPGVGNLIALRFPFWGEKVGVSYRRDILAGIASSPPDYIIDGRVFRGSDSRLRFHRAVVDAARVDGWSNVLVAANLKPRRDGQPHTLDIVLTGDQTVTAATNKLQVYALLGDSKAGYREARRINQPVKPVAVPTSSTVISVTPVSASLDRRIRGVRKIVYTNTTGAAIQVTVTDNGTQAWANLIPANGTLEMDFGAEISLSGWNHLAASAGVNYTVHGGW